MNVESKHREVSRQLLSEIAAGKYGASGRLPGEEQLVKKFGVSRTTVGRALRDLQTEGVIERRAGSGTYVRRQNPNSPGARQLGLLIPELAVIEIFTLICGELASVARAHEHTLLWGDSAQQYYGRDILTRPWDRIQFAESRFALGRGAREGVYPRRYSTDRATKPQGKTASARRVAVLLACGFVARRVTERCGYAPLLAPRHKPKSPATNCIIPRSGEVIAASRLAVSALVKTTGNRSGRRARSAENSPSSMCNTFW